MTVEAGLTLAQAQAAAASIGRLFPLSLASEASCQIGGNLASNAGGVGVLAYGTARQLVLGLEVVLADGRVLPGLSALKKDNTGYDLKDLFIGSEGTLGIITAATLRLYPKPAEQATAFVVLPELAAALALFAAAQAAAGASLTAFEFMPRRVLDVVLRHTAGARDPLPSAGAWYALIELSGLAADGSAQRRLEDMLSRAQEQGLIIDAALANSLGQARAFWRLREAISEAQKFEGGSVKNDGAAAGLRPFWRRQCALQHPAARRDADGGLPGAHATPAGGGERGGAHFRRLDFGRARHWRHEARGASAPQKPARTGADAGHQGGLRPQGHSQSRQGAVRPAPAGRPHLLRHDRQFCRAGGAGRGGGEGAVDRQGDCSYTNKDGS